MHQCINSKSEREEQRMIPNGKQKKKSFLQLTHRSRNESTGFFLLKDLLEDNYIRVNEIDREQSSRKSQQMTSSTVVTINRTNLQYL